MKQRLIDSSWKSSISTQTADWKELSVNRVYTSGVMSLEESFLKMPNGNEVKFIKMNSGSWANVFGFTEDNHLIVIEQYRLGVSGITLEVPGGMVEAGESPEVGARREFTEETGWIPKAFELVGSLNPNPAFLTNKIYFFLATGCEPSQQQHLDEGEMINVSLIKVEDFEKLIDLGQIEHALVVAGWSLVKKKLAQK
jgi:8-oxo-dGTP pyrophosphatase MutT (NUDIX family)